MKTTAYNPSELEVELAFVLSELKDQIEGKLTSNKIEKIENRIKEDNPAVIFFMEDSDGDKHEVVIKIIQRPDKPS